jgi:hypothetical protein
VLASTQPTPFGQHFKNQDSIQHLGRTFPQRDIARQFIQSFKEFPPSQRSGSMNLDQVMEMLSSGATGGGK